MIIGEKPTLAEAALADAKAYLRIGHDEEDALLARLLATAVELCEHFTGLALIARDFTQLLPASGGWRRLGTGPVRAISGVGAVAGDGTETALASSAFAIDIDAAGEGWIRILDAGEARRVRARFEAGLASEWEEAPEALRQGILRLAAHLYTHRDNPEGGSEPPAAVTALWRPWRRLRIG